MESLPSNRPSAIQQPQLHKVIRYLPFLPIVLNNDKLPHDTKERPLSKKSEKKLRRQARMSSFLDDDTDEDEHHYYDDDNDNDDTYWNHEDYIYTNNIEQISEKDVEALEEICNWRLSFEGR